MLEVKQPASYKEQIQTLRKHGCIIEDEELCKEQLAAVKYYRLSAYFLPFKQSDGRYKKGTSFEKIYKIYEFDRKLRSVMFSAIEEIEVFLRSGLSYYHAFQYGPLGYLEPANYNSKHNAEKFQKNMAREIKNNEKVLFVRHHLHTYDGQFPIWVATELFTFGMLSYFYNDMTTHDQKQVAQELYGEHYENLGSWLRCCTDLRNICAHYGRLYYRIFTAVPAGLGIKQSQAQRLWGAMLVLKNLYPFAEKWEGEVLPKIEALFAEYDDCIDLYHVAFPDDWQEKLRKKDL